MDWNPATSKGVNEVLALGFSDGSFRFISRAGKLEKEVKGAHKDAAVQTSFPFFDSLNLIDFISNLIGECVDS